MRLIVSAFIICFLSSCQRQKVSTDSYLEYVNNPSNGLLETIDIGDLTFIAQYRTNLHDVLSFNSRSFKSQVELDSMLNEKKGTRTFTFSIKSNIKGEDVLAKDLMNQQQYEQRIQYLIGAIQNDFFLIQGKDTIPCIMHHFERTYHLSESQKLMLVFELPEKSVGDSECKLMYKDKVFGVGNIVFTFSQKAINAVPDLII